MAVLFWKSEFGIWSCAVRESLKHLVDVHIEHGQNRVRVALAPVAFYGRADKRLGQDEVCEVIQLEELRVR